MKLGLLDDIDDDNGTKNSESDAQKSIKSTRIGSTNRTFDSKKESDTKPNKRNRQNAHPKLTKRMIGWILGNRKYHHGKCGFTWKELEDALL